MSFHPYIDHFDKKPRKVVRQKTVVMNGHLVTLKQTETKTKGRARTVNDAFDQLRQHVPLGNAKN